MRGVIVAVAALLGTIVAGSISAGHAAEIKVISANGMREVIPKPRRSSRP